MTWQAWTTLLIVVGILAMLMIRQRGADLILLAGVIALMALGILDPRDALAGMSNQGMITVAALFVVAAAMERTGAMNWMVDRVMGRPRSLAGAQLRVMSIPSVLSAFLNNTPMVAMMLPVISDWARKNRISVSKLLLPMNYAVILGGLCTLIGTSTNLVVNGLLIDRTSTGLGMFDVAWIGLPALIIGSVYMIFFSRWLLPERKPAVSNLDDPREYTVEMMVEPGSPLAGKTIEEAGLRHLPNMYLMEIDRHGEVIAAVAPTQKLESNDRLVFCGVVDSVKDLQRIRGLVPATDQLFKLQGPRMDRRLIEAVVSNTCPLAGKTVREGRFRTAYDAVVIAVGRNGDRIKQKIGDITLRPGDTLLLEANPAFVERQRNSRDFYLVSEVDGSTPPNYARAPLAIALLTMLVVLASTGVMSMLSAALLAAGLMVFTGCISGNDARKSIDWEVLLVIAASFGIASAMEKTGAAATVANHLISLGGENPLMALAMVYLTTMLFTELMSNNAAAVLTFPIAWATAESLHVSPMPFIISLIMASSCGFATPLGYQTNLMVYGPGGYRFSDYLRFGGLLNILVAIITLTLAPLIWPFHPPQ
jgi:di/tricarboxylate transporter